MICRWYLEFSWTENEITNKIKKDMGTHLSISETWNNHLLSACYIVCGIIKSTFSLWSLLLLRTIKEYTTKSGCVDIFQSLLKRFCMCTLIEIHIITCKLFSASAHKLLYKLLELLNYSEFLEPHLDKRVKWQFIS